jgi:hypothetical protein
MWRLAIVSTALAWSASAAATAVFQCDVTDKHVALALEGHVPYEANRISDLKGAVEIEAGKPISFGKSDVKHFSWKQAFILDIRKRLGRGAFVEIKIRARAGEDETSFSGTYALRTERLRRSGAVACGGG